MDVSKLPALNAALNATSGLLLVLGFIFIRLRAMKSHAMCMAGAFLVSILFLVSYVTYHYHHGSTPYQGTGWLRPVYFFILITHIILAAVILPLASVTLFQALRGRFDRHVKAARAAFPIWLYVSVTGVVIYWMLYHANG
jgi:uncharacterized membrane protein YozB (DUF420 family)